MLTDSLPNELVIVFLVIVHKILRSLKKPSHNRSHIPQNNEQQNANIKDNKNEEVESL
jgi:hypothetical protein